MPQHDAIPPGMSPDANFATTRWSVVRAAGRPDDPASREALETLCRLYWYPLYVFARSRGADAEAAADRVQSFFADFIGRDATARARPEAGRFRSYLLVAFRNHLGKLGEREAALRRGGAHDILSLDVDAAESRLAADAFGDDPERAYERAWCRSLLENVRGRLAERYGRDGHGAVYSALEPFLLGTDPERTQAEIARSLRMTEVALKVALHRLRRRYAALLRQEVAQTLDDPAAIDAELQALMATLSG